MLELFIAFVFGCAVGYGGRRCCRAIGANACGSAINYKANRNGANCANAF